MCREREGQRTSVRLTCVGLLLVGSLLVLAGCGYQARASGTLAGDIRRLHVAAIRNDTFRAGLQGAVASAVRNRLLTDGGFQLVDEAAAEAVLGGTVQGFQNDALTFDLSDVGRRFRIRVTLKATLRRAGSSVDVPREVFGEAFYTVGAGVVGTRTSEEEAVQRASQDLATRLVAALVDGW